MKVEEILKIIEALGKTDLTEFSVEQKDFTLKMGKGTQVVTVDREVKPNHMHALIEHGDSQEKNAVEVANTVTEVAESESLVKVTSPMVGTYYEAPSPDSPNFVKVGDLVDKGDVLCIIEAMKLMNEIDTNEKGKIVKVLVENGELVEFGQTLFLIEPF